MPANPLDAVDYDDCGCDVSDNNPGLDFGSLANNGSRKYCFLKITEGLTYQDKRFSAYLAAVMRSEITRIGIYHFAHHESAIEQMQFFIGTFKAATAGLANCPQVLFMLDLERGANPPLEEDGIAMVQALQAEGINPVIYCGYDYWSENHSELASCPNFLAAYNNNPISPVPWRIPSADTYGWDIWQYTNGTCGPWAKVIPGGGGPIDLSCFNLKKHPEGLDVWWDAQLANNRQP